MPYLSCRDCSRRRASRERLTMDRCDRGRRNPQHQVNYLRCAAALARQNRQLFVPANGQLRDLPLYLDVQGTKVAGECSTCAGRQAVPQIGRIGQFPI